MSILKHQAQWVMNVELQPPSFLPGYLDTTHLIDITPIGAQWRRYLDPNSGKIHDGAGYYAEYMENPT